MLADKSIHTSNRCTSIYNPEKRINLTTVSPGLKTPIVDTVTTNIHTDIHVFVCHKHQQR